MIDKKVKFFWKMTDNGKLVTALPLDETVEYYFLLKKYREKGFRQIIITSEIMIKLIEYFVLNKKYKNCEIELMESDEDLSQKINSIIEKVDEEQIYFSELIKILNFISEKSSIEIKKICFKGRDTSDGKAIRFYVKSNGIIGVNEEKLSFISDEILNLIQKELF